MDESEIDNKLRSLETELEEMKRRTQSFLNESTFPPPTSHASLVASLVDRTPARPVPHTPPPEVGSLDQRLERDSQDRKISDLSHTLALERSAAAPERQRRAQAETELEISRRRISELESALVEVRRGGESEILSLRSELRSLQQEISVLESALVEVRREGGPTDAMNRKFLEAEISAHHAHRLEAERRAEAAERNLGQAREEISDMSMRLAAVQEEVAASSRKFHNMEISSKNFQQIDAMRVEAETAVIRLRRELGTSEISRRESEISLAQLFKELDDRKNELKFFRDENFRCKAELEAAKLKLHAEISDNKNLKISLDQLRHELKISESKISDLNLQRTAAIRMQHDAIISDHTKFIINSPNLAAPYLSPLNPSIPYGSSPSGHAGPGGLGGYEGYGGYGGRTEISEVHSPRSEISRAAPPPWATHENVGKIPEFARGKRAEVSRDFQGRGVAGVFGEAQREEEERKEMEKELMELNVERQSVEAWLGKIPLYSGGRTVVERKEKQAKEFRLSCVDARIAQIKQTLRKRKQLI